MFFPALISGRLFDTGHLRVPLLIASITLVLCTFLIAECHEYWHFLLCQGFGVGVGAMTTCLQELTSSKLSSFVGLMWCHIRACVQYRSSLVQKKTVNGVGNYFLCVVYWWHGVPGCIPQLERYYRVRTSYHLPIHSAKLTLRFKWSLRIIAIILMFVLGIVNLVCNVLVRTR